MNTLSLNLVLFTVLFVSSVVFVNAAENTKLYSEQGEISIELNNGLLSIETNNAPLHQVIHKIGELAGFKTVLADDFIESPLINVSYQNILIEAAVERLVSDKNRIVFYESANNDEAQRTISQIWLLGSDGATGNHNFSDNKITVIKSNQNNSITSAKKQTVKDYKLIRLTKMLQENQTVQVRTRAVISLGTLQDERAVLALEAALLDQHASVRSEAISALGRIGGDRATMVLGNILLNTGADVSERVNAAKALWNQDSEVARGYLRAGANDKINQVRMASIASSSTPKSGTIKNQLGETGNQ